MASVSPHSHPPSPSPRSSQRRHTPDLDTPLALTLDEICWLQASEILKSPVKEVGDDNLDNLNRRSKTWPPPNPRVPSDAAPQPDVFNESPMTPPTPSSLPSSTLAAGSSRSSQDTFPSCDTPPSSSRASSVSGLPRLTLSRAQNHSLRRDRTRNKNRFFHVDDMNTNRSDHSPAPSPSSSLSKQHVPSPLPIPPVPAPPKPSSSSIPPVESPSIPATPRTPLSRSLSSQRTEWIYRQPKPRSPPALPVNTAPTPPPPPASASTPTPTPPPKPTSPTFASRIPVRPRTRSTTSSRMRQRSRQQLGHHPHVVHTPVSAARKPVHSTLPARPIQGSKPAPSLPYTKPFWSTLLSRSKSNTGKRTASDPFTDRAAASTSTIPGGSTSSLEFLDAAKEKFDSASSSFSSLLSFDILQPGSAVQGDAREAERERMKSEIRQVFLRPPLPRSGLSTTAPMTPPSVQPSGTSPSTLRLPKLSEISASPTKITTKIPVPTSPSGHSPSRTRSSSSSSNSSAASAHSSTSSATASTAPATPTSSHVFPPPIVIAASPSKSILSRTSSTNSASRPPPALLFGNGNGSGAVGGGGATKCVTFVDVPTVHYAAAYPYSEGKHENDAVPKSKSGLDVKEDTPGGMAGIGAHGKSGKDIHPVASTMIGGRAGHETRGWYGGHRGYNPSLFNRRDYGVDVEGMDLDHSIDEEDEEGEDDDAVVRSYPGPGNVYLRVPMPQVRQRAQQQQQYQRQMLRSNTVGATATPPARRPDPAEGGASLKRLMSVTRKETQISRPTPRPRGDVRPTISGPFVLGSLPPPLPASSSSPSSSPPPSPLFPSPPASISPYSSRGYSRTNSSTTSLRSFLSYTPSIRSTTTATNNNVNKKPSRVGHYKSQSYPGRTPQSPFTPESTNSPYHSTPARGAGGGTGVYSTLRPAPSMESFKSTAGRSVRSLSSIKSTASTRGFRAWLSRVGENIGISGPIDDADDRDD